jgi:chaperonin cofactor prefoldin
MDSLQEQISIINTKVDALHQMIERFDEKTSDILSAIQSSREGESHSSHVGVSLGRHSYQTRSSYETVMEHKDVLLDNDYPDTDSHSGERALAPEVQIQRLTAQLTAAYNRIAALEEQLLARRIH